MSRNIQTGDIILFQNKYEKDVGLVVRASKDRNIVVNWSNTNNKFIDTNKEYGYSEDYLLRMSCFTIIPTCSLTRLLYDI